MKLLMSLLVFGSMSAIAYDDRPDFVCKSELTKRTYNIHFTDYTRLYVYDQNYSKIQTFDDFYMDYSLGETNPVTKIYTFRYNDDQSSLGRVTERGSRIRFTRKIHLENGGVFDESASCVRAR